MVMSADKDKIELIFNDGRDLEIPFFQRSYVWGEENWARFMDDMTIVSDSNKDYFLGSLIFKEKSVPSRSEIADLRAVIDGQQRLTTIVLFFKIILDEDQEKRDSFKRIFFNRSKKIILKHNHNDQEIFESIVNGTLDQNLREKYKNNKVLKCYKYFEDRKDDLKKINVNVLLNKLFFVVIDLTEEEDPQRIFDTINSLGVSLTTAELLKNELFEKDDEKFYENTWKKTFEQDGDSRAYWDEKVDAGNKRSNIDVLLQSVLLNFTKGDVEINRLFENYKDFLKNKESESKFDRKNFINTVIKNAELYREKINPDFLNQNSVGPIERFNIVIFGLKITTAIPYFLYLLNEVKEEGELNKMINLLESYLVRRCVCKESSKSYNTLFASFIRNKINSYQLLSDRLCEDTNNFPDDIDFGEAFLEKSLMNKHACTILYLIEMSERDSDKPATELRSLNNYSLEHVMPKKWEDHWKVPDSFKEEDKQKRNDLIKTLGNLTIITESLNRSIGNASWKIKKEGKDDKGGLNDYSKGITIFEDYLKCDEWDEEKIEQRGKYLFELAKEIWKYACSMKDVTKKEKGQSGKYSEEDKAKCVEMVKAGYPLSEITAKIGPNHRSIKRYCEEAGVEIPKRR